MVPFGEGAEQALERATTRWFMFRVWAMALTTVLILSGVVMLFLGTENPGGELDFLGLSLSTESGGILLVGLGVGMMFFVFKSKRVSWGITPTGEAKQQQSKKDEDGQTTYPYQASIEMVAEAECEESGEEA